MIDFQTHTVVTIEMDCREIIETPYTIIEVVSRIISSKSRYGDIPENVLREDRIRDAPINIVPGTRTHNILENASSNGRNRNSSFYRTNREIKDHYNYEMNFSKRTSALEAIARLFELVARVLMWIQTSAYHILTIICLIIIVVHMLILTLLKKKNLIILIVSATQDKTHSLVAFKIIILKCTLIIVSRSLLWPLAIIL